MSHLRQLPGASRKCSWRGGLKMHHFFHILQPSLFCPEAALPSMQSSSRRDRARVCGSSGLTTQPPRVASANPASVPKRCSTRYIFKPPAWIHVRTVADTLHLVPRSLVLRGLAVVAAPSSPPQAETPTIAKPTRRAPTRRARDFCIFSPPMEIWGGCPVWFGTSYVTRELTHQNSTDNPN